MKKSWKHDLNKRNMQKLHPSKKANKKSETRKENRSLNSRHERLSLDDDPMETSNNKINNPK